MRACRCVGVGPAGPALPGFVDLQGNGFGGVDFLAAEPADYRTAAAAIAPAGVTAYAHVHHLTDEA